MQRIFYAWLGGSARVRTESLESNSGTQPSTRQGSIEQLDNAFRTPPTRDIRFF
jgi:hypothetical protein